MFPLPAGAIPRGGRFSFSSSSLIALYMIALYEGQRMLDAQFGDRATEGSRMAISCMFGCCDFRAFVGDVDTSKQTRILPF